MDNATKGENCDECKIHAKWMGTAYCHQCKVDRSASTVLENPSLDKWDECASRGKPHFVSRLAAFFHCADKIRHQNALKFDTLSSICCSTCPIVGLAIARKHAKELQHLLTFAQDEWNNYRFSPIDFSLVRFERECDQKTRDFWLTLCCAFDMGNYLTDLIESNT